MSRTTLITLMLVLPAVDLIILAIGALTLKAFRDKHPQISTPQHLAEFKGMVKLHKYLALASIPILWLPSALFFGGLFIWEQLGLFDLLYAIAPSGLIILCAKLLNGLQHSVETLPVATDELRKERDRVVGVWHNQALPDW